MDGITAAHREVGDNSSRRAKTNPIQSLLKQAIPITGVLVVRVKTNPIATVHTRVQIFSQLPLLSNNLKWFICVVVKNRQATVL